MPTTSITNLPKPCKLYDQALQINTRRVSLRTRLHSLIGAGDAASDLQQIPAAKHWLEEASRWISQSPADPQNQLHLQQTLTKFYKATRQYALALKHYETANLLEDSLLNAEKIKRLSELQTRYETEKKDREITSLQYQKAAQEASLARRSWQRNLFIGLLLAVLLISGLVYRTIRLKQRHQRVLLSREQELHEAKSRFFTDIAHEFRSPLTLIQGPAEQIILHSTDPNCRQQAKLIRKQSGRLLQLVNQILYLSRLEAGVISQHRREQDLVSFLRGMVHAYESLAEQLKLNLCFSSSISRYITSFDKDQFEKIFTNLLTNACKFTPPQGKISLEISTPQAHEVVIIVRDTGRGISEEHLPSIFDRYYTASGNPC
jgi:signal transduction histidine kinase